MVDDQPAVLEVASRILHHNGYHTLEAGSYDEALSLLSTHDPDLLLTDTRASRRAGAGAGGPGTEIRPGMRILHMSGAHVTALGTRAAAQVISKPFTAQGPGGEGARDPGRPPGVLRNSYSVGRLLRLRPGSAAAADGRQQDGDRGADARFGIDLHVAADLGHDPIHGSQAEARALALGPGGEERLERAVGDVLGLPMLVLLNFTQAYRPDGRPARPAGWDSSTSATDVCTTSVPPDGMASRALTARLTRTCSI